MIENGADVNGVNKVKHTPLMIAAIRGHINALTLLIKHGADVDLQDSDGYKALHFAVYSSDISSEIFSCLIGIGADVNARTNNGVTPLMIAAEEGHINAVTSLVILNVVLMCIFKTKMVKQLFIMLCKVLKPQFVKF